MVSRGFLSRNEGFPLPRDRWPFGWPSWLVMGDPCFMKAAVSCPGQSWWTHTSSMRLGSSRRQWTTNGFHTGLMVWSWWLTSHYWCYIGVTNDYEAGFNDGSQCKMTTTNNQQWISIKRQHNPQMFHDVFPWNKKNTNTLLISPVSPAGMVDSWVCLVSWHLVVGKDMEFRFPIKGKLVRCQNPAVDHFVPGRAFGLWLGDSLWRRLPIFVEVSQNLGTPKN